MEGIGRPEGDGNQMKDITEFKIVQKFVRDQSFVKEGKQEVMGCRPSQWLEGLNMNP